MLARPMGPAAGFDADNLDRAIADKREKHAGRVAAAAHAGDDDFRKLAELAQTLLACLLADDRLEVADHHGEGVRANNAADDVMSVGNAGYPFSEGFVDRVAQRPAAAFDREDFSSHRPHLED